MILVVIFLLTALNYADRSILSLAGPRLSAELGLSPVTLGYIFSAFGWSYMVAQIPGGWALDRFGTRMVYAISIALWSTFTLLQGAVGLLPVGAVIVSLFTLRLLVGLAEAPALPANSRVVQAWFPASERGFASMVFNSGQYFATVLFAPLLGWLTQTYGWPVPFVVMGLIGLGMALVWLKAFYPPREHPLLARSELDRIVEGGAIIDLEQQAKRRDMYPTVAAIRQLVSSRMMIGIYIAQYSITTLTYFFLTWFPVYLVKARGLSIMQAGFAAVLPALCGFAGSLIGGALSDLLLRRTGSLTLARKTPIIVGMLLSTVILLCNYVDSLVLVISLMALSFFGKGIGSLGWAVVADTSPREAAGINAGMFNTFGNVASISTPIAIGYLVAAGNGSFEGALIFVAVHALLALGSYVVIVGPLTRFTLEPTGLMRQEHGL